MELTTNFQKIGTGIQKQYGGSTGQLELWAKYNSLDIPNNKSNVTVELRLICSSYIGNYQATYWSIGGDLSNGGNLGSGDYYSMTLGSATGDITHNADGTRTVNFNGNFNPTAWGYSIDVSGSATLPNLHKPPEIKVATMVETNQNMITLGIPDTTVVKYLSQKTITLDAEAFDSATLKYRLRHFNTDYALPSATTFQNSDTFSTDYTTHDVMISDGKAQIIQDVGDSLNGLTTDWVYVTINGTSQKPDGIAYAKPNLERTSTTIRRKSGNGTNLTDNKANVNVVGTIYKANDLIGNNNSVTQIGYKVWENGTSEPANYTSLTPTTSGGNITITDFEISNIVFTKIYNYKIILTDNYGYNYVVEGIIPLGQPTWSEYKDRVDFLKLTVEGYNPFEYNDSEEIVVGKWIDGKPIYRVYVDGTTSFSSTALTLLNNVDSLVNYNINVYRSGADQYHPLTGVMSDGDHASPLFVNTSNDTIQLYISRSAFQGQSFYGWIEYTKTTD